MFWKKILKFFKPNSKPEVKDNIPETKQIKDLKVYDDVFIKIDNQIYSGWVTDISKNSLSICYEDKEYTPFEVRFIIKNLKNQSVIKNQNKTLIINQRDAI